MKSYFLQLTSQNFLARYVLCVLTFITICLVDLLIEELGSRHEYLLTRSCFLQLSALLSDIGLNIREAHVFSTTDGYSLDVFVVDGWPVEVFH